MLKKLITLAAATAMFGANAAAQALNTARTAVKGLAGSASAADETKPGDGTKIQPSIPPMPPMEKAEPAPRKVSGEKGGEKIASKGKTAKKATSKPSARKSGSGPKTPNRKSRHAAK